MVKMTFTFDDETVESLRRAGARLKKSSSAVVREAIQDYARRIDRLSESERGHLLKALDRIIDRPSGRTARVVDTELRSVRTARRAGGRRTIPK
jgi:predicted transcriptional regulator